MTSPVEVRPAIRPLGAGPFPGRAADVLAALPAGTPELAATSLAKGLRAAGQLIPNDHRPTADAAARQLVRPLLETDDWPGPSEPLIVGTGAVHADLIDDDHDQLARLRAILAADGPLDPERLAAEAQQWRLPVTPYRALIEPAGVGPASSRRRGDARSRSSRHPSATAGRPEPTDGLRAPRGDPATGPDPDLAVGRPWDRPPTVVDLSSLWAGPLATSLLAELGARVVKVDPRCRPDGLRAHPRLYASLNGAKEIVDLDLRRPDDRRRFEALVADADLVIDSFSRRVMPNFGYAPHQLRAINPSLATLSIVAFPAGTPESEWISYGPGVHAASGLAANPASTCIEARFRPAPIAYPDALAGLAAFARAAELLDPGRREGGLRPHREISLAGALRPLVERARRRLIGPGAHG
jgi:hypothetical protein